MNKMLDYETVETNGKLIGEGKDRNVYKYGKSIFKISKRCPQQNSKEYIKYLTTKSIMYNPIIDINWDSTILEVEECIDIPTLILKTKKIRKSKTKCKNIENKIINEELDIFDIINEYNLDEYMKFTKQEVLDFCEKNHQDKEEILFPFNWGYNKKIKSLVIIDYAD